MTDQWMICVKEISGKGRGLVAARAIEARTLICEGPYTVLPLGCLDGTPLEDHVCELDGETIIVWGPQTLINHSDTPNCECELVEGWDILTALNDIAEGEELTVDYRTVCDRAARGELEYV